jgi:hypothetical protein
MNRLKSCNKKKFSKNEAIWALKRKGKSSKNYRREIRYYFCEECQAHHLSSKEDKEDTINIEVTLIDKWTKLLNHE